VVDRCLSVPLSDDSERKRQVKLCVRKFLLSACPFFFFFQSAQRNLSRCFFSLQSFFFTCFFVCNGAAYYVLASHQTEGVLPYIGQNAKFIELTARDTTRNKRIHTNTTACEVESLQLSACISFLEAHHCAFSSLCTMALNTISGNSNISRYLSAIGASCMSAPPLQRSVFQARQSQR
jgi:hypothetical protein